MIHFVSSCKAFKVLDDNAAGTDDTLTGDEVDCQGVDSLLGIVALGDVADTAVITAKFQTAATSGGDYADTDASVAFTATGAATGDDKIIMVELTRPVQRYAKLLVVRETANAEVDSAIVLASYTGSLPTTASTGMVGTATQTLDG